MACSSPVLELMCPIGLYVFCVTPLILKSTAAQVSVRYPVKFLFQPYHVSHYREKKNEMIIMVAQVCWDVNWNLEPREIWTWRCREIKAVICMKRVSWSGTLKFWWRGPEKKWDDVYREVTKDYTNKGRVLEQHKASLYSLMGFHLCSCCTD